MVRHTFVGLLSIVCCAVASASVEVITDAKNGDEVHGEYALRATVRSDNLVTKVEMYVGDQLKDSKSSTPYIFQIDTLGENDGPYTVKLVAYTTEGEKGEKTLTLNINNELAKGADYHLAKGQEALTVKKWGDAVTSGRTALKIKPGDKRALLLLARANYGKGTYDLAEKFARDVLESDKTDTQALQIVSAVSLRRAFSATTQNSPEEVRAVVGEALKNAAKAARTISENSVANTPARPPAGGVQAWADSLLAAGRYSLVAEALRDPFESNVKDNMVASRYLFALIRSSRMAAAIDAVDRLKRRGAPDGYTYALMAVVYQTVGNTAESLAAEKQAALTAPDNIGVLYATAYLSVLRDKTSSLGSVLDSIAAVDPSSPIVNSYMSTRMHSLADYSGAQRHFETAIMADPGSADVLVERGRQIVDSAVMARPLAKDASDAEKDHQKQVIADRLANAQVYFEAAIEAKPDSQEALTGLALVHALQGHADQAAAYGQAAAASCKTYALGHLANAVGLRGKNRLVDSTKALNEAAAVDNRLRGRTADASVVWRAYMTYGRTAYLPTPAEAH
ncbi:MAG: tetratricopeptide repeat protein [Fimbriimonadaceae bacterium]|nr:tetratricopeptide repeat protein [Fimbriimonadaceae bacterium]